jgi:nicotinate phosphoribosyltransferase
MEAMMATDHNHDPLAPWIEREGMGLLTDLYQLTMAAGYFKTGMHERRVAFEYFFRELPRDGGFAVFAGLEQALAGLAGMRFSGSDLAYLRETAGLDAEVIDFLAGFKPELDVWAMPEGTLVFPHEPLVRVEGPLAAAQLVETYLLNALNYPTLIATKAARVCLAAGSDPVVEFGLRRAQGPDGGLTGARAAYVGGCVATSNVLAGKAYGIPIMGTHAHSWVMSHPSELAAFRAYAKIFPEATVLLVDTYDTIGSGVPNAVRVFTELREKNPGVRAAIRLDSGDLARLSKEAYQMLTAAGFSDPRIVASNDLDEDLIADLKRQGARINSWGVGTQLITGYDHPALGGVYKVVAVMEGDEWQPRLKLAGNPEKTTDPGRKQVHRLFNRVGAPQADLLMAADAPAPSPGRLTGVDRERFYREYSFRADRVEPLLALMMSKGELLAPAPPLGEVRARVLAGIKSLGDERKRLRNPDVYPVLLGPKLARAKERLIKAGGQTEDGG